MIVEAPWKLVLVSECVFLGRPPLRCSVCLCHRSASDGQACEWGRGRALTLTGPCLLPLPLVRVLVREHSDPDND